MEEGYLGTLRLARDLRICGDLVIAGGMLEQGNHVLSLTELAQFGGILVGGVAQLWIEDGVRIENGSLETPRALMRARTLDIRAPGIVRVGENGRLELAGEGTPLTGDGLLDATSNRPTSVEFTGHATTDLVVAGSIAVMQPLGFGEVGSGIMLAGSEDTPQCVAMDTTAGFIYFGTSNSPGAVVKVRLSDFTRVGALMLNPGEDNLISAVIDPAAGFAYFGTKSFPGKVVKIRLSDFTRVGALSFGSTQQAYSAAIDTVTGFAYFGTEDYPEKIVKVRLSDFVRVGVLTFSTGVNDVLSCAVIDPRAGFAYFGTHGSKVVKVRLSDFTLASTLVFDSDDDLLSMLNSAVIDPSAGFAYFGAQSSPAQIVKVRLSDFTRVGLFSLIRMGSSQLPRSLTRKEVTPILAPTTPLGE